LFHQYSFAIRHQRLTYGESLLIVGANPFIGFLSVIQNQIGYNVITDILNMYNNTSKIILQPWQVNIIFDAVISCIMIFLSIIRIQPVIGKRK